MGVAYVMPRLHGRRRRKHVHVRVTIDKYERWHKRLHSLYKRRLRDIYSAMRRHRQRIRDISRRRIVLPRVRRHEDLTKLHVQRIVNELKTRMTTLPQVEIVTPTRLIEHRYCLTSKPTYIHVAQIFTVPIENVLGIYMAIKDSVNRLRRPMTRSTHAHNPDFEPHGGILWHFMRLLEKWQGSFLTRIIKLLSKPRAIDQNVTILRTASGYVIDAPLYELAVRPSLAEKAYAVVRGQREAYIRRDIKHCSFYTIVKGLKYKGLESVWYWWHKRYKACEQCCRIYEHWRRDVCYTLCESVLADAEPHNVSILFELTKGIVQKYMSRLTG